MLGVNLLDLILEESFLLFSGHIFFILDNNRLILVFPLVCILPWWCEIRTGDDGWIFFFYSGWYILSLFLKYSFPWSVSRSSAQVWRFPFSVYWFAGYYSFDPAPHPGIIFSNHWSDQGKYCILFPAGGQFACLEEPRQSPLFVLWCIVLFLTP